MVRTYDKIALIACCREKLPNAAQVRNLYTSEQFKREVAEAENAGYRPFVLSARHGLLDLDEVREPYDEALEGKSLEQLDAWAHRVSARLVLCLTEEHAHIRVLAAGQYAEPLARYLAQISRATVEYPFNQVAPRPAG